jgi:hypothetical protein
MGYMENGEPKLYQLVAGHIHIILKIEFLWSM